MVTTRILAATAGLTCISGPALSQNAPPEAGSGIAEIIVTAQKREQNLQDVPVAVTVVSATALESVGGSQLQDLTKLAPSLTISQGNQQNNNSISLRGIGTVAFSIGVEPSVLVVIDDVANSLQGQAFNDLQDIERIEILRGPQSTLFGKSASAGVINITTKIPTDTLTAKAEAMVTDDDEQRYTAGLSGPLTDTLRFSANAAVGRYDGNVKELQSGRYVNGRDSETFRAKLLFTPTDGFDATLIARHSETDQECCQNVAIGRTPGITSTRGVPSSVSLAGITPGIDNFSTRVDPLSLSDSKDSGASLKLNFDVGGQTLTSVSAWGEFDTNDSQDFDGAFGPTPGLPLGAYQEGTFSVESLSQEFRLTSAGAGAFQYVVGAYFAFNDYARRFFRAGPVAPGDWLGQTESDTTAAFGQVEYSILPATRLIGGLRWSTEDISFEFDRYLSQPGLPPFYTSGSDSDSVVTGKAGIQQDLTPDIMLFATYSRGYKGQAYDLTSSFTTPTNPASRPVAPEQSDNYEIGMKGSFFDRRMVLNTTAFYTDYDNFQSQTVEPTLGGALLLANVGSLRTRGVEAELSVQPVSALTINGSVAYVDAIIKDYKRAECYFGQTAAQGCLPATTGGRSQDLSGRQLANAPEWKFNLGADLDIPLGTLPVDGFFNVNYSWQSETNFSLTQDPLTEQGSYGILNASIGFADRDTGRYKFTLFVRNALDKHYYTLIQNNTNNFSANPYPNPAAVFATSGIPARDSQRYFGFRLTFDY